MAGQPNLANGGAAWRRQQLLDKFLAGEIDRPMYDSLLAELQQWGESSASAPVSVKPSAELASSSDGEEPRVSVTKTRPGLPSNPASQPSALPEPGDELGGFRLEKRLGRGGMGEVWKASDLVGERTVVLKLLKGEKGKRKGKSGQKGVKKGSKRGQKGVKKGAERGQKGGRGQGSGVRGVRGVRSGQEWSGVVRSGQEWSGVVRSGQEGQEGQDGQVSLICDYQKQRVLTRMALSWL